jgi:uncharacterized protein DUF6950
MQRLPHWQRQLAILIQTAESFTFAWGQYDCALFAARAVREITGLDIGAPYAGTYSDEAGAIAIFTKGYTGPASLALGAFAASLAAANNMPEVIPVTFARRGDVVWVDNSTPENPSTYGALGVVSLDGRYAACMSDKGVKRVHMQRWKRAWRVG